MDTLPSLSVGGGGWISWIPCNMNQITTLAAKYKRAYVLVKSMKNFNYTLWKYGITGTVPTCTGYYGYNDTTEVVVELTHIFL